MSYILNALKKAERDRLREDPQELDNFASAHWDPYKPEPVKDLSWLKVTVVLVPLIVLIGVYFVYLHFTSGISGHLGLLFLMLILLVFGVQTILFGFIADMIRK